MIYTITGVTGYIGHNLMKYLTQDEDNFVYAVVRESSKPTVIKENIEYITYDGTESSLKKAIVNSDYLIHLGALYTTKYDEKSTLDLINSNIVFSTQIFNVAERENRDLVIASASTFSSLSGNGCYNPATLYAATKKAVEDIAYFYKDLSIHFLTFPDTYGENDWRPKIHNILRNNESWPFEFRSPANQEMKMLHVDDVIGHLLSVLKQNEKGVFIHDIYSEGTLVTLKELSEAITDKECLFSDTERTEIPKKARNHSVSTGYTNKHTKVSFKK